MKDWNKLGANRQARIDRAAGLAPGKVVDASAIGDLLTRVIEPGDRVCLEGNNQKQADFLAQRAGAGRSRRGPRSAHGAVGAGAAGASRRVRARHRHAARFSFPARRPRASRGMLVARQIEIGAIHTYLELFARYFIDLTPHVALIARTAPIATAISTPAPNTEDTPTDRRGDGVQRRHRDRAGQRDRRHACRASTSPATGSTSSSRRRSRIYIEPLFTRDPAADHRDPGPDGDDGHQGHLRQYGVQRLNHGIGFDTAAIELLLPTYAEKLGLKGKIASTGRSTRIPR